jgi:hypothetical protein
LVVVFIVLYNTPLPALTNRITGSQSPARDSQQAAKDSASKKDASTTKTEASTRRSGHSRRSHPAADPSPNITATKPIQPDGQSIPDDPRATVKSDSAPVYSMNSRDGSVVRVLKKGDKVRTDIEVVDNFGRWHVIGTSPERPTGFVRNENLEPPAKSSSQAKKPNR